MMPVLVFELVCFSLISRRTRTGREKLGGTSSFAAAPGQNTSEDSARWCEDLAVYFHSRVVWGLSQLPEQERRTIVSLVAVVTPRVVFPRLGHQFPSPKRLVSGTLTAHIERVKLAIQTQASRVPFPRRSLIPWSSSW